MNVGKKKCRLAHRILWSWYNGPIPDGLYICHRCDNPACVNPEHLFIATKGENNKDMARKGRANRPRSPLKLQDVIAIRAATGKTQRALAKEFGVSQCHIWNVRNYRPIGRLSE